MSNKNENEFNLTDTADHLKNGPERERHLPTMPDPSRDNSGKRGQHLPTDPDPVPAKKPAQINDPLTGPGYRCNRR